MPQCRWCRRARAPRSDPFAEVDDLGRRTRTRRGRWFGWLTSPSDDDDADPWADVPELKSSDPSLLLERARDMDTVQAVLGDLPLRQQQAFMLRIWEGLDTAATAAAMDCSEGSVKTHLSRAMHTLRARLEEPK